MGHRLEISTLSHLWADHRLSRATKLRLYRVCVCSSLTHCCEAWTLNRAVTRSINGFNSRCLHVLTGEHYRETAISPDGWMERMVRRALMALYLGSQTSFGLTACCKRSVGKNRIYIHLGTKCAWTTLTDFCWKFVGTI